jgi:ferredoxin-NADP reductase
MLANPPADWTGRTGLLTADIILSLINSQSNPQPLIYISGPEPLIESLEQSLHASGISSQQLVLDFFPGYVNG